MTTCALSIRLPFLTAIVLCAAGIVLSVGALAEEVSSTSDSSFDRTTEIDRLIGELTSRSFIQSDWAARRLMSRGASIVPQLTTAVRNDIAAEEILALLTRMSESNDSDMAASSLRAITNLRQHQDQLSSGTRRSVETAYRNSIRSCLAQLSLIEAVIKRDEHQNVIEVRVRSKDFGDRQLMLLLSLTTLRSLDLRDTKITDAGLRHLASLTELVSLNCSDTLVTSSGLRELEPLQQLKEVVAYRIDVTPADRDWLREHLPGVTITNR